MPKMKTTKNIYFQIVFQYLHIKPLFVIAIYQLTSKINEIMVINVANMQNRHILKETTQQQQPQQKIHGQYLWEKKEK